MKKKEKYETLCGGIQPKDLIESCGGIPKPEIVYSEPIDYFPKEIRKQYKLGEFAESETLRKIKSVMLGHAVGDALGVPVEFCSREELAKNPVTDMRGYGTYPVPAGAWSDDTSMSLVSLEHLMGEELDWNAMMSAFCAWCYKGKYTPTGITFDVGSTCRRAIDHYALGHTGVEECGLSDESANGNGALMRIHPFVLYAYYNHQKEWDWMGLIQKASKLTHAHARSVLGCYIYAYCLTFLLEEATKESLKSGLDFAGRDLAYLPEFEHYTRLFRPDFSELSLEQIKSTGYVVDTLEAALWCVLTTDSYRDCVLKAVNLGEDTDTVAAIAGGLAGALYGYDEIPEEWLETLIKREKIEKLCKRAFRAWK